MKTQVRCPVCGSKLDEDAEACNVCNTAFEESETRCPLCDSVVNEDDNVCPNCNAVLEEGKSVGGDESPEDVVPEDAPQDPEDIVTEDAGELPASSQSDDPQPEKEEVPENGGTDQESPGPEETGSEFITGIISASEEVPETPDKAEDDEKHLVDAELEELVKLPGIGPLMAQTLFDAGYTSLRKLKRASVVELMNIQGIGRKAAGEIKSALREADLEDIRQHELTEDQVETEYQCPLCSTIVSAYETSCYECGTAFNTDGDETGDSDRLALSYYDSKLLRTPDNPELWYARGATLMKMEDYDLALNSLDRALEIDPEFQTAWVSKAEVYNKLGDSIKAAECYGHVITKSSLLVSAGEDGADDATITPIQVTAEDVKDFEAELDEGLEAEIPDAPEETSTGEEPTPAGTDEPVIEPEPEPVVEQQAGSVEDQDETQAEQQTVDGAPVIEGSPLEVQTEVIDEEPEAPEPSTVPVEEPIVEGPGPVEAPTEIIPETMPEAVVVQPPEAKVKMDYTKPSPEKQYEGMSEKDLKSYLAKRATHVKPLLALAKETEVSISSAKLLISQGVASSKKGDLAKAVILMDQGIETIESDFRIKLSEDISYLAGAVRDLKVSGMNVSKAVDLITMAKGNVEGGKFREAFNAMKDCLELVENITI